MDHALRQLIFDKGRWTHPNGLGFSLKFNHDGTGELRAVGEMGLGWLFELSMHWKFISTRRSIADIMNDEYFRNLKHTNMLTKRPTLLGSVCLEIQLSPVPGKESPLLSYAAYLPRKFTIVVERGNFAAVYLHRFELRMTFDTSLYPTVDGYNHERKGGPPPDELYRFMSDPRSFYASELSDELLEARATEDDTIWGHHTSNCVLS